MAVSTGGAATVTSAFNLLERFRRPIKPQLSEELRQYVYSGPAHDEADWIYHTARHILISWPAALKTQHIRLMFLMYMVLTAKAPEGEFAGTAYAELLPEHDIDVRLGLLDGALSVATRVWPKELRSDWSIRPETWP